MGLTLQQARDAIQRGYGFADELLEVPELPELYDAIDHLIWKLVRVKSEIHARRLRAETDARLHAWMPSVFKAAAE